MASRVGSAAHPIFIEDDSEPEIIDLTKDDDPPARYASSSNTAPTYRSIDTISQDDFNASIEADCVPMVWLNIGQNEHGKAYLQGTCCNMSLDSVQEISRVGDVILSRWVLNSQSRSADTSSAFATAMRSEIDSNIKTDRNTKIPDSLIIRGLNPEGFESRVAEITDRRSSHVNPLLWSLRHWQLQPTGQTGLPVYAEKGRLKLVQVDW